MAKGGGKKTGFKVGFFHMVRDVLCASMNKGQLLPVSASGLIALVLWRLPEGDLSTLTSRIVNGFADRSLLGYIAAGVAIVIWPYTLHRQRKSFTDEMKRVTDERNSLQEQLHGQQLKSSEKGEK